MMVSTTTLGVSVLLAVSIATLWQPLLHRATVLGLTRPQASIQNIHGVDKLIQIPNTVHCEDVHYHQASNTLYTACEGATSPRRTWFPPLGLMSGPGHVGQGKLVVVNPSTFEATELELAGFTGPLVTHGIDIFPDPDKMSLTIFAVNHLPNPDYDEAQPASDAAPQARSQIEIFRHAIGSNTAVWVRSVRHTLIRTPNDIFATSATSFYVTNDHHYRTGTLRHIEDFLEYNTGAWSDVVHVTFSAEAPDVASDVAATIALAAAHNPNGLGHSTVADEVLLSDAAGGELYIMSRNPSTHELKLRTRIQLDSTVDNPSYYDDPYAVPGNNASGYLLAGLPVAHTLAAACTTVDDAIPSIVWHIRTDAAGTQDPVILFQDDGKALRSASAAVLVGIDPASNSGKKQAWLFVTGFLSEAMVATKVDL